MTPDDLTCSACRELLLEFVSGHLTAPDESAVGRHLAGCMACRQEAESWRAIAAGLAEDESHIPPDTHASEAWVALRGRLPRRSAMVSSPALSDRLAEYDADLRGSNPSRNAVMTPAPRRSRSGRPALPVLVAAVLICVSLVLFGVIGGSLRGSKPPAAHLSSTPTPSTCPTGALSASIPPGGNIFDISMASPRDGWAVGWIWDISQPSNPTIKAALMLHFQNCRWQPVDENIPAAELLSVSMDSATDGWAVGATASNRLLVLHYTGGNWHAVQLPRAAYGFVDGLGMKVHMTSPGEGWMLIDGGHTHITPYTTDNAYTLLHYQGRAWTPVPLTFDPSGAFIFTDIASDSADDCWVVGYSTSGNVEFAAAHYHDGVWTTWNGAQLGISLLIMYSVAMTSPTDVWIAGSYPTVSASGDGTAPLVLRYDGTNWTRENIGNYVDQVSNDHDVMSLTVQSPTELWALTDVPMLLGPAVHTHQYQMAHYQNGVWTWISLPNNFGSMNAAVFVSDSEGYAAAQSLTGGTQVVTTALLHYVDGTWSVIPSR